MDLEGAAVRLPAKDRRITIYLHLFQHSMELHRKRNTDPTPTFFLLLWIVRGVGRLGGFASKSSIIVLVFIFKVGVINDHVIVVHHGMVVIVVLDEVTFVVLFVFERQIVVVCVCV